MNGYFIAAAVIAGLAGIAHSLLGENLILKQLDPQHLSKLWGSHELTHKILRVFWHVVTLVWFAFGAQLVILAAQESLKGLGFWIGVSIASLFSVCALFFLIYTQGSFRMGYVSTGLVAVLTWIGLFSS
ncbi:MAG: hypothetical protein ACI8UO_002179 [Verrucomicrobiales bacterium]|jgi:hypothetical protein